MTDQGNIARLAGRRRGFLDGLLNRDRMLVTMSSAIATWMRKGDVPPDVEFGVAAAPWPA